jgi:hypothetical protein
MSDTKLGNIFFRDEKGRRCAYWRGVNDTSDMFLCSASLAVLDKHAHLQALFREFAMEVNINRQCSVGNGIRLRDREPLPRRISYAPF